MTRREALLNIMRDAAINTRARHPSLRGPFVISDESLDNAIAAMGGR